MQLFYSKEEIGHEKQSKDIPYSFGPCNCSYLDFVFYSKSSMAKVANNFREDYLKISMKAIQTNPELVTVSKKDKNGEFKDITAKFYIDYITDI